MNTVSMLDENGLNNNLNQEMDLTSVRIQKGYTLEYVANKLHLRTKIIELIEANDFKSLPGPVFIKGYIRAYTKLLDIAPEPYLALFDDQYVLEKKPERALWQSKKESHKAEHAIRWFTVLFGFGVLIAVGIWWQKNQDNQRPLYSEKETITDLAFNQNPPQIKLTDISKMQSLLHPKMEMSPLEKNGD